MSTTVSRGGDWIQPIEAIQSPILDDAKWAEDLAESRGPGVPS